jgi:hypothetical protein
VETTVDESFNFEYNIGFDSPTKLRSCGLEKEKLDDDSLSSK